MLKRNHCGYDVVAGLGVSYLISELIPVAGAERGPDALKFKFTTVRHCVFPQSYPIYKCVMPSKSNNGSQNSRSILEDSQYFDL
jgi:hypothetical protein